MKNIPEIFLAEPPSYSIEKDMCIHTKDKKEYNKEVEKLIIIKNLKINN